MIFYHSIVWFSNEKKNVVYIPDINNRIENPEYRLDMFRETMHLNVGLLFVCPSAPFI